MLSSRWARRVTWVPGRGQRWSSSQQGAAVAALVDAYRRLGHRRANIDPLGRRAPLYVPCRQRQRAVVLNRVAWSGPRLNWTRSTTR